MRTQACRDVLDSFVKEKLGTGPARVVARRIAYLFNHGSLGIEASWDVLERECRCDMEKSEWALAIKTLSQERMVLTQAFNSERENVEFVHRRIQEFLVFEACAFDELAAMRLPEPNYSSWVLDHGRREACVLMIQMEASDAAREACSLDCGPADARSGARRPGRQLAAAILGEIVARHSSFEEFGDVLPPPDVTQCLNMSSRQQYDLDVALHIVGILADGLSACIHPIAALEALGERLPVVDRGLPLMPQQQTHQPFCTGVCGVAALPPHPAPAAASRTTVGGSASGRRGHITSWSAPRSGRSRRSYAARRRCTRHCGGRRGGRDPR